jgi:DNA modification methylase
MDLSERDKELIISAIRRGEPLPSRFRQTLFDDPQTVELIWPGKTTEVERTVLPFQSIEQIDEPRSEESSQLDLFSIDKISGRQKGGWTNKLIWGDNKLILSSLVNGPLRQEIEDAGGLKLVYIDPPFDVGADFSIDLDIGDEMVTKEPSIIEAVAYRDTWGNGIDSFASMIHQRIALIHNLLRDDGCLYLHCDWRVNSAIRLILDEVFGSESFVNEIIWSYRSGGASKTESLARKHDYILLYRKSEKFKINTKRERQYLEKSFMESKVDEQGRFYVDTILRDTLEGELLIVEKDQTISRINTRPVLNLSAERLGYPTQKPEGLITLLTELSSEANDLVADFFCGSGTTLAVAEKLGRKWIGADLSRFAIHTTRKRLIAVQRDLKQ